MVGSAPTAGKSMVMLHIRELDPLVHEALAQQARQQHRSLSAQAATTLAQALGITDDARLRRRNLLQQARLLAAQWPATLPPPEDLLAEDRSR